MGELTIVRCSVNIRPRRFNMRNIFLVFLAFLAVTVYCQEPLIKPVDFKALLQNNPAIKEEISKLIAEEEAKKTAEPEAAPKPKAKKPSGHRLGGGRGSPLPRN